jgi:hypothetical protein
MSKDFRIKQLRSTQIIASGSSVGTVPSLLVYSASAATDIDGNYDANLLSSAGTDVWMFVSGTRNDTNQSNEQHSDKVLFSGDVVISGTLYAEKQVMEVNMSQTSDLYLSGAVVLGDQGAASSDSGQARFYNTVGANSGSLFVSTGSLYLGRNISGTYSEIQILPNTVTAGNGIGTQDITDINQSLNIDINNLTGSLTQATIASDDLFAVADIGATNNEVKKITLTNVAAKMAGSGLSATDGVVALDLNDVSAGTIDLAADSFAFVDANDSNGTKKQAVSGIVTAMAGDGIQASSGVLAVDVSDFAGDGLSDDGSENLKLDLNSLASTAAINQADSIAFIDSDNTTKKGTIDSLVTAIAGTGLSNSSSQLALTNNSLTVTAGDGLKGGGTVSLGSSVTINVEPNDFAGTGLEDDGSDNLRIATTAAGDGLTGGGGSALSVATGTGLNIAGSNVVTDDSVVAHLSGSEFTGNVVFEQGLNVSPGEKVSWGSSVGQEQFIQGDSGNSILTIDGDNHVFVESDVSIQMTLQGAQILSASLLEVVINQGGMTTPDFRVESTNMMKAIYVDAGMDYISIGDDTGIGQDTHLFVSGVIGGINDNQGVAVFGGDVVISGSLLDATHSPIRLLSYKENGTFSSAPSATGTNAIAIGNNAVASGNNSIAMGTSTTNQTDATGIHSLAIGGDDATASGQYASAIGGFANTASGNYSLAMGRNNTVSGENSIGIGKSLTVSDDDNIVLGNNTNDADIKLKGAVEVLSTLTLPSEIIHEGDLDTKIAFDTNDVSIDAGGRTGIKMTSNQTIILATTASSYSGADVAFFVSGSKSSRGTVTRGTAVFGGDMHISGALSGPSEYSLTDSTVRLFRDGNILKFDDGENTVKTLSQLASTGASTDHFVGVHGSSPATAKLKATGSVAFSGASDNFVDGLASEGVGQDVFVFFSGSIGSKDGTDRGVTLFGGDTAFSGSATYLGDTVFSDIEATVAVKTPVIQDSSGNESIRINSQKVAVGSNINANPNAIFEAPLSDNTQAAASNATDNFNIFINNRSVQTDAFAGIAFDVSTEVDADSIGAAIRTQRDAAAGTTASLHDANLTFSTNDAGDAGLTERMRITHDGKVGIGSDDPAATLHVAGGDVRFEASGGSINADKDHALFVDHSTGRIGIHESAPDHKVHVLMDDNVNGQNGGNNSVVLETVNNSYNGALLLRRARGTVGSESAVTQAVGLGEINFEGYDGTDYEPAVGIRALIDYADPGNNDMPGLLSFRTTSDGSSSLSDRMYINSAGQIICGPVGTWVGQESETLLSRNDWNAGSSQEYQLGLYNGASNRLTFSVDPTGNVGVGFAATTDEMNISGSLKIDENLKIGNDPAQITIRHTGADGYDGIILAREDSTTSINDLLGGLGFDSTDGNVPSSITEASAFIAGYSAESHGTGDKGGYLILGTSKLNDDDDTTSYGWLRIDNDGQVGIGNIASGDTLPSAPGFDLDVSGSVFARNHLQIGDVNYGQGGSIASSGVSSTILSTYSEDSFKDIQLTHAADSDTSSLRMIFQRSKGTLLSKTVTDPGTELGKILWNAYDGSSFRQSAAINVEHMSNNVNGTPTYIPTGFQFQTNNAGASSSASTTIMVLDGHGNMGLGQSNFTPLANLHVKSGSFASGNSRPLVKFESDDGVMETDDTILNIDSADSTFGSDNYWISFTQNNSTLVGSINSEVAYTTFTGQHPTLISGSLPVIGSILKSTGNVIYREGISNAWVESSVCTSENDKAVVGVYAGEWSTKSSISVSGSMSYVYNAIGEGQVLVTDLGGDIEVGDYISSSTRSGHGQKQSDDILRNYTVAKANESIDWSSVDPDSELGFKSKLIACTYHCG